ncbi:MAG: hypothetical protein M5U26_02750 [Planctomycetota bacterium]|nr:hypothetical protein [Planctomycetota bacterium]
MRTEWLAVLCCACVLSLRAGEGFYLAPGPYAPDAETLLLLHLDEKPEDASPAARPAEAGGGAYEPGVVGTAWRTDGKGPLKVALAQDLDLAQGFTLEAWVRLDRDAGGDERVVLACPGVFSCHLLNGSRSPARVGFRLVTDQGACEVKTDDLLPYERWAHIAWTFDPQAPPKEALKVFVHGLSADAEFGFDRRDEVKGAPKPAAGSLLLGAELAGALDEVRLSAGPRLSQACRGPWLSGCWGDFTPFVPGAIAPPAEAPAPPNACRLLSAQAVPTFQSIGLYVRYEGDANDNAACAVAYRKKGAAAWRKALDLVPDRIDRQFRGSLLGLEPGTAYEVALSPADPESLGEARQLVLESATWAEEIPVGEVRELPGGTRNEPLLIEARGKPDAWIVYRPAAGARVVIDAGTAAPDAVLIRNSSCVVLEGVTVLGGTENAVRVRHSDRVRIRHCEMRGWGTPGAPGPDGRFVDANGRRINYHAGIKIDLGSAAVVAEHNFIHTPRGHANNWSLGHPMGPQAFVIAHTFGNHVLRYNDAIGSDGHRFNDVIESLSNGSVFGGPFRDTDIHDNLLVYSNDDAVELDGGQINVRFFNNRLAFSLCGISCAPCRKGPAYIYRNVLGPLGDDRGSCGSAWKMGGGIRWSLGRGLILHNTVYGPGRGLASVGYGSGEERGRYRAFARNNLFAGGGGTDVYDKLKDPENDFDYDLLGRGGVDAVEGAEAHAVREKPVFVDEPGGDWRLAEGSPGFDAGQPLPGVNDGFAGKAPDMGAFEFGGRPIPWRPHGLAVAPQWVKMDSRKPESGKLALVVPAAAGTAWTARPSLPWLKVTPAEGQTAAEPQALALSVEGLEVGDGRAAVTFRTDAGYQITALVQARVYPDAPWEHLVEAEAGELAGGMKQAAAPEASGGAYVHTPIPPDGPDGKPGPVEKGEVVFKFEVPADGAYYVRARCLAPEPSGIHDSFYFSLDGEAKKTWGIKAGARWAWSFVADQDDKQEGAYVMQLKKGPHALKLLTREPGASIDRLTIANHPFPAQAEE